MYHKYAAFSLVMNKHDRKALDLLKSFVCNVNGMIECMEAGDLYTSGAIGGIIDIDVLLQVRDELVRSRMEDDDGKVDNITPDAMA